MIGRDESASVTAVARASLYDWADFQDRNVGASLLLVELALGAPPSRRELPDKPGLGAAGLVEVIDAEGSADPSDMIAGLLDRHRVRLSFLCIAVVEGSPFTIDQAVSWGQAGRAAGATFIVISALATADAQPRQPLLSASDTLLFSADRAALLHAARLLLEHRQVIGYDVADMMLMWRGRVGWVEQCPENEEAMGAALDRAREHFSKSAPAAVSLLFAASDDGPTLTERDALITGMQSISGEKVDLLAAVNEPIWEREPGTVEVSILFNVE